VNGTEKNTHLSQIEGVLKKNGSLSYLAMTIMSLYNIIMLNRLHKSRTNRVFFGVCGGIAEYFNINPLIVRLIFLFTTGGAGTVYLILAIFLPEDA